MNSVDLRFFGGYTGPGIHQPGAIGWPNFEQHPPVPPNYPFTGVTGGQQFIAVGPNPPAAAAAQNSETQDDSTEDEAETQNSQDSTNPTVAGSPPPQPRAWQQQTLTQMERAGRLFPPPPPPPPAGTGREAVAQPYPDYIVTPEKPENETIDVEDASLSSGGSSSGSNDDESDMGPESQNLLSPE